MSLLFMFLKSISYNLGNLGWFICVLIKICYLEPDPRFLKWLRIRILPNDTDPTGSGSVTLVNKPIVQMSLVIYIAPAPDFFFQAAPAPDLFSASASRG